ncbi:MAG: hypothetical protein WAN50_00030 [Minisyncoccia bacterium]
MRGAVLTLFLFTGVSFADASSGTIDPAHKYAWGSVAGWVNFAAQNGNISVTDSAVTGYAWSANDGWINLSPTGSGVMNDSHGNLSGFAWDSQAGFVSFLGVTIDSLGKFHGKATGANSYAINFDCSTCDVRTTWRSTSSSTVSASPGAISPIVSTLSVNSPASLTKPNPSSPPSTSTSFPTPTQTIKSISNTGRSATTTATTTVLQTVVPAIPTPAKTSALNSFATAPAPKAPAPSIVSSIAIPTGIAAIILVIVLSIFRFLL